MLSPCTRAASGEESYAAIWNTAGTSSNRCCTMPTMQSHRMLPCRVAMLMAVVAAANTASQHSDKHIAFLKTHKTGGSTIASILRRLGLNYNLRQPVPLDRVREIARLVGCHHVDTTPHLAHCHMPLCTKRTDTCHMPSCTWLVRPVTMAVQCDANTRLIRPTAWPRPHLLHSQ